MLHHFSSQLWCHWKHKGLNSRMRKVVLPALRFCGSSLCLTLNGVQEMCDKVPLFQSKERHDINTGAYTHTHTNKQTWITKHHKSWEEIQHQGLRCRLWNWTDQLHSVFVTKQLVTLGKWLCFCESCLLTFKMRIIRPTLRVHMKIEWSDIRRAPSSMPSTWWALGEWLYWWGLWITVGINWQLEKGRARRS